MLEATKALDLARDAYAASTDYFDNSIRSQMEDDIRQWQGMHPSGSKYASTTYKGRSKLFRPKTRAAIRRNEAMAAEALFSTLDTVAITARDDSDAEARAGADVMQALLQYRLSGLEHGIPWFLLAIGAYQDAMVTGVVASYHYWRYDRNKGIDKPWLELIPAENLRFDPAASWCEIVDSTPYIIRLVPMRVMDVRRRMKEVDAKTGVPRWKTATDSQLRALTKNQWDTTRMVRQGSGRTDTMDASQTINDFSIVWAHQNVCEWNGQDYTWWTGGTEMMFSEPVPLENEFPHGRRPFVLGFSGIETHKPYPSGPVRETKDVQQEINDVANSRLDNVKFVLNKRYFVKRGRQVDLRSLMSNVPGSATMMTDPAVDVLPQSFPDVTSSSYQEQDRLNLDFDDISGSFSGSSVASNRKLNETVGGMNILTTNQNQLGAYRLRTFVETWVEPALRQTMWLEREYEADATVLAVAGRKAQLWSKYGLAGITEDLLRMDMSLTVNVGMGATNPQDKVNNLSLAIGNIVQMLSSPALQQYGLKADELIKEVLGAVGYKDGGRFFDFESQEDPRIADLTQQIQALQQALDAKVPPELLAAQVEEIKARTKQILADSVNKGVQSAYSAMQAGAVVAQSPGVAPVADEIMRAVGFQEPVPSGVDPNLVGNAQPMPDVHPNTSPAFPPVPQHPETGMQGIETPAFDAGVTQ